MPSHSKLTCKKFFGGYYASSPLDAYSYKSSWIDSAFRLTGLAAICWRFVLQLHRELHLHLSTTPYTCYTLDRSGFHGHLMKIHVGVTLLYRGPAIMHPLVGFNLSLNIRFVVGDLSISGTTLLTIF